MWGGIAAFLIGAILSGFLTSLGLCLFAGGVVVGLIGAGGINNLYRCPECDKKLLVVGSRLDAFLEKYPNYCPNCGVYIRIEKE